MTRSGGACLCAFALSLLVPALAEAQGPPPPPPPPPPSAIGAPGPAKTGTARLAGRVTALDTGRPIRRAQVRATSPDVREGKTVSTDADGRWKLTDLPGGRFTLSISKAGYVGLSYGQKRPFEAGKNIDVAEGQTVEKLDVALPRASAITGRVVDEFGDPVANSRVSAVRPRSIGGQRRMMNYGSGDTTDDLGQYRLHGLPPGDYYVTVSQPPLFLGSSEDRMGYAPTFHPSALLPGEATRVSVTVGQEAQNIVIALTPTKTATLAGTATTSDGKPIPQGVGFLRDAAPSGSFSTNSIIVRDGKWSVSSVVPGEYILSIQFIGNIEQVAFSGGTGSARTSAEFIVQPITVTGEDMKNIALVAAPGATAKGRLKFDGTTTPPAIPSSALIIAAEPSAMGAATSGRVQSDGTFELTGLYGKRLVRPLEFGGWILKSVTLNGEDVTDTGFDAPAGAEIAGLEVTLTKQAAELSGTVATSKNEPVKDFVVVLFPPEAERWGPATRFVRSATPDQTGRFVLTGMPPGSYLAVALEYMEPGEETNPEFLEKLKPLATSVRLGEGEKKVLTLKLVSQ